jgi:predicted ribosome quality control (RQC) complex YloA/Tae2 family protein
MIHADVVTVTSPSGHTVHYGRNAKGNHVISSQLVEASDYWFHAASGVPGSHVLLKHNGRSKTVTKEDKAFCRRIAIERSKCKSGACGVCVARGQQVTVRDRGDPLGTVVVRCNGDRVV